MTKNHLTFIGSFLLAALFIVGCQKETMETKETTDNNALANSSNNPRPNSCRMTINDWPTAAKFEFHYNAKGLADKWITDYGFGSPLHTNEMTYDNNNRLIESKEFYFGSNYVYHFYYTGKLLTRLTRINIDNPADAVDFLYTYNNKGQNTRQDDYVSDQHVLMTYDNMGNCTLTNVYFGNELIYSDNYTFSLPARNPRAAVPGVETGFIAYGTAGFDDKRQFTSNRTEFYDNGTLLLFNDYDPAQTTINTGNHNYPISATYYDRVTETPITISFDYENCKGNGNIAIGAIPQGNSNIGIKNTIRQKRPLLIRGSQKAIKDQIQRMKQQLQK